MRIRGIQSFCIAVIAVCSFSVGDLSGQDHSVQTKSPHYSWQLVGDIAWTPGLSSSMRGSVDTFIEEISEDYTNSAYPFDSRAFSFTLGGELRYMHPGSRFFYYAGLHTSFFFRDNPQGEALMSITSFSLGAGYVLFHRPEGVRVFGRAGINANVIGGEVRYRFFWNSYFISDISFARRFGAEAGVGAQLPLGDSPLFLESYVGYFNANIIGKSYTAPSATPPEPLLRRELNDAANPEDDSDDSRTIDFLILRLALGVQL